MQFELWGATVAPFLEPFSRGIGYLLLLGHALLLGYAVYWHGRGRERGRPSQWLLTLGLCITAILASQFLILLLPNYRSLPPIGVAEAPRNILHLLGFVPVLVAAILLNPTGAILVGLSSGLGRALWQSHEILDLFHYAWAALLAWHGLRQNYIGRHYAWLRRPPVSAVLALLVTVPLLSLFASYAYAASEASWLAAVDVALSAVPGNILTATLEGLVSGFLVSLAAWSLPQLQTRPERLIYSPISRTLIGRLLSRYFLYSALLILVLITTVFYLSLRVSTQLIIDQMTHDAETVSDDIDTFITLRQNLLAQAVTDSDLLSADETTRLERLDQLFRAGPFFRRLLLMEGEPTLNPTTFLPNREQATITITAAEEQAIERAFNSNQSLITAAHEIEPGESGITFIEPIRTQDGDEVLGVLLGRVPSASLQTLVDSFGGSAGTGSGFIVGANNLIIAHTDPEQLLDEWIGEFDDRLLISSNAETGGQAYQGRKSDDNTRRLVYTTQGPNHGWTVVATVPYDVVLGLALQTALPIIGVLLGATLFFSYVLWRQSRSIVAPLQKLAAASQDIASGEFQTTVSAEGYDEIGQLSLAFSDMQTALRQRLNELSLLLNVSREVSGSLNLSEGVPLILEGALEGTEAVGVRLVLLNLSGRYPLTFGSGPAASAMAKYDERVTKLMWQEDELMLTRPVELREQLDPDASLGARMPFKSIVAFALRSQNRFLGVMWLGYRQIQTFEQTEVDLLRTLASQAAVLMENARLFANAEGGRRRLAAVLSSTTDAVIVTDETDRILLINPAMERLFDLKGTDSQERLRGRKLSDVIDNEALVQALTASEKRTDSLEIPLRTGQTYFANVSTIVNANGQDQGRVAVLHDITYMKELDEMKSDFVQMVSHDLRGPLTYMHGFISMLPMVGDLNEKQEAYLEKTQRGIEQMNTLVKNLLDLGRLEAGLELIRSPVRLDNMLQSIAKDLEPMAEENGVSIELDTAVKIPYLNLDSDLVRQAISNLVSNAIKYAPNSGPITLKTDIVPSPNGSEPREEVVISVADCGPGIPKQEQPRIFEKFVRVQQRDNLKVKGSGLGLSIVKQVAERHHGRAWFESTVGKGSTFYIAFPNDPADLSGES